MEFFDKKQDVIDLQITQFGRFLLSKGKFKPVYYSFHDDNILYNSESGEITEPQNDSEPRIKETPTMQPQISFSSLDKDFRRAYEQILMGVSKPGSQELQQTAIRNYTFSSPIGTSNINTDFAPAWSLMFLKGKLSGSAGHIDIVEENGGKHTINISQLETEISIETTELEDAVVSPDPEDFLSDFAVMTSDEDMTILLRVQEENAPLQKKNFDIEVFEVIKKVENGNSVEALRPLYFDATYVQHYFDLLTDDEINDDILCKYDPERPKRGVFADPRTKLCQEVAAEEERKVYDIYEDETDFPGEVC